MSDISFHSHKKHFFWNLYLFLNFESNFLKTVFTIFSTCIPLLQGPSIIHLNSILLLSFLKDHKLIPRELWSADHSLRNADKLFIFGTHIPPIATIRRRGLVGRVPAFQHGGPGSIPGGVRTFNFCPAIRCVPCVLSCVVSGGGPDIVLATHSGRPALMYLSSVRVQRLLHPYRRLTYGHLGCKSLEV